MSDDPCLLAVRHSRGDSDGDAGTGRWPAVEVHRHRGPVFGVDLHVTPSLTRSAGQRGAHPPKDSVSLLTEPEINPTLSARGRSSGAASCICLRVVRATGTTRASISVLLYSTNSPFPSHDDDRSAGHACPVILASLNILFLPGFSLLKKKTGDCGATPPPPPTMSALGSRPVAAGLMVILVSVGVGINSGAGGIGLPLSFPGVLAGGWRHPHSRALPTTTRPQSSRRCSTARVVSYRSRVAISPSWALSWSLLPSLR
ncbi:hypothetical protein U9M48_040622 [Paspalum notatum var. saurae]|uniref:Uncharacterized protein n=1 Tax=Paspalum notatum var. saurae TaxID=547442 RepID=A0AAQ3UNU1_PASNO